MADLADHDLFDNEESDDERSNVLEKSEIIIFDGPVFWTPLSLTAYNSLFKAPQPHDI